MSSNNSLNSRSFILECRIGKCNRNGNCSPKHQGKTMEPHMTRSSVLSSLMELINEGDGKSFDSVYSENAKIAVTLAPRLFHRAVLQRNSKVCLSLMKKHLAGEIPDLNIEREYFIMAAAIGDITVIKSIVALKSPEPEDIL